MAKYMCSQDSSLIPKDQGH